MPSVYTPVDAYHATVTLPVGGDPRTAASVNTAFQPIADNAKYAHNRLGTFRYHDYRDTVLDDTTWATNHSWTDTAFTLANSFLLDTIPLASFMVGDQFDIKLTGTFAVKCSGAGGDCLGGLLLSVKANASAVYVAFPAAEVAARGNLVANKSLYVPFCLQGRLTITDASVNALIGVDGYIDATAGFTGLSVQLVGSYRLSAIQWRLN